MKSSCYIVNWDGMKNIAGASGYRYGGRNDSKGPNEKEILQCKNSRTKSHFVVGNGCGSIEYDPAYDVAYSDCTSKRFFSY